jgi:hypothetical protein
VFRLRHEACLLQHPYESVACSVKDGCICCLVVFGAARTIQTHFSIDLGLTVKELQLGHFTIGHWEATWDCVRKTPEVVIDIFKSMAALGTLPQVCHYADCNLPIVGQSNSEPVANLSSRDTESEKVLKFVTNTIANYLSNHMPYSHGQPTTLPTRVLDISNSRICLKESVPTKARYAALNHCWGRSHAFRTIQATYEKFQKSIIYDSLPKTFRDAVTFTRKLGV